VQLAERTPKIGAGPAHDKAVFESLMLATSAPQFPAPLAALGFLCGASWIPVIATITLATFGVLALGLFLPRHPPAAPEGNPPASAQRAA
jgi:hypothetical protein